MKRPIASSTIPTMRGWRGVVVVRLGKDLTVGWECPHNHMFRDVADNCAGRAYRRWSRTGEEPK